MTQYSIKISRDKTKNDTNWCVYWLHHMNRIRAFLRNDNEHAAANLTTLRVFLLKSSYLINLHYGFLNNLCHVLCLGPDCLSAGARGS